jgi:GPH family glycoside/pentoside/hexuronide:cation symporter
MIPDIIEMDELQTRQRREGSYYAFASFFQKLGTGFAIWLMGQAMTWTGYITPSSTVPIPVQPEGALISIRLFASVLPAVLLIVSILFAWRYPISREVHRDMLARLDERK